MYNKYIRLRKTLNKIKLTSSERKEIIMRVTKIMKEYVVKEMNKKKNEKFKLFSASYEEQRKNCIEDINIVVNCACEQAKEILIKNGMDIPKGIGGKMSMHELISFHEYRVNNQEKSDEVYKYGRKLSNIQEEKLNKFFLECDLGCDKEQFYKMIEEMNFED